MKSRRPWGPSVVARRTGPRTGGMGAIIESSRGPLSRENSVAIARHASPSPAANCRTDAAVSSTSVDSTAHRPSAVGWARTAGARRHRNPYDSRSSARMTGDATPSG